MKHLNINDMVRILDHINANANISELVIRETQMSFKGASWELKYRTEIITNSGGLICTISEDKKLIPNIDAFSSNWVKTGTPVVGMEQKIEQFKKVYEKLFERETRIQKKVIKRQLELSLISSPTVVKSAKRL
ncbi:hypothetical protein WCT98_11015 [Pectobacterium brasiliense]|uniref:hypothetical protein n=1 Tax=Pectobacterium brasiliense TaxID=180957 RepID=UPI0030174B7E